MKVKYGYPDQYVSKKIEPFLHVVPILMALVVSVTYLVNDNYNNSGAWDCVSSPTYYPPHCLGYDDGTVPEGFEIPCGRGSGENFYLVSVMVNFFAPPVIIGGTLGLLFRTVSKQERQMKRYGERTLNTTQTESARSEVRGSVMLSISRSLKRLASSLSERQSDRGESGRAILNKAAAYSMSYFLAWMPSIIGFILVMAGIPAHEMPLAIMYMINIFNPLEGFFNLLIFVQPKVMAARQAPGADISLLGAFGKVIWKGLDINCCIKCSPTPSSEGNSLNTGSFVTNLRRKLQLSSAHSKQPIPDTTSGEPAESTPSYTRQITFDLKEEEKTEICATIDDTNEPSITRCKPEVFEEEEKAEIQATETTAVGN